MIKSLEKKHVCLRRTGDKVSVRLSAYRKNGTYKVSKGPNVISAEIPCQTLEEVVQFTNKGYMVRMQSDIMEIDGKRRRINGLYSSDGIEVSPVMAKVTVDGIEIEVPRRASALAGKASGNG